MSKARVATTRSEGETIALGRELAERLRPPAVVLLYGSLGAGKTTLAKGLISGLGVAPVEEVLSPTFTFVHEFRNGCKVYHVDLYRIERPEETATLGLEEILSERAIVLVEWPERLPFKPAQTTIAVTLEVLEGDDRRIQVDPWPEDE